MASGQEHGLVGVIVEREVRHCKATGRLKSGFVRAKGALSESGSRRRTGKTSISQIGSNQVTNVPPYSKFIIDARAKVIFIIKYKNLNLYFSNS